LSDWKPKPFVRLAIAAFKGFVIASIVWVLAIMALGSRTSPYVFHATLGASALFVLATAFFVIKPSPLGDASPWDGVIHPEPPRTEPRDTIVATNDEPAKTAAARKD
jgi:hypothetical protein